MINIGKNSLLLIEDNNVTVIIKKYFIKNIF